MRYQDGNVHRTTALERFKPGGRLILSRTIFAFVAASLVALAFLLFVSSSSRVEAASVCDKYASVKGSDKAKGTKAAPFRSAQKLVNSLRQGQTGCLRAGVYKQKNRELKIKKASITLRSVPKRRATIKARVYVPKGANRVTVRNLKLDGSTNKLPSPTINANHTRWINNIVTNRNTAICFNIGHSKWGIATGTQIRNNKIHHCGKLPRTNYHHGIYIAAARNTKIVGNHIYKNADRGIQLYPDAQGTLIKQNTIRDNGQGIIFGGKGRKVSSGNVVRNNVIAGSKARWNVESSWKQTPRVGKRNKVYNNCLRASNRNSYYNKRGGIGKEIGFNAYSNRIGRCSK